MELTLDQALQKGVEAHKAGQVQEADRYYTAILKANPEHPDANHNMGVLAVGVGKVEESLPFFKAAIDTNANIEQFWLSYIDAFIKLERIAEAKAVLDQAKSKGVNGKGFDKLEKQIASPKLEITGEAQEPPKDQLQPVINLYTQGKLEETLNEASKLLNNFPNSVTLYNIVGAANQFLRRPGRAVEAYKKAINLKPDYAEAYNNMANSLREQGKLEEAVEAYGKAISIKPDYAEAYNNMGVTCKEQGDIEKAINLLNKAISIKPDYAEAYNNIGVFRKQQGNPQEAIQVFKTAVSIKPDYAEAYNNMGVALQNLGKLEEATESYKKAITVKPAFANAHYNMGVALQNLGKLEEAIEIYTKTITLKPDYIAAWLNGAEALEKWNKLDELETWLKNAFKSFTVIPPDLNFIKSKLLWRNKKYEETSTLMSDIKFETVSELRKQDYLKLKAKCFEKSGNFDKAYYYFAQSNSFAKKTEEYLSCDPEGYFLNQRHKLAKLRSGLTINTQVQSNETPDFNPTFLVGFPRSGTTLLDVILRSHSKIRVVEEKPLLKIAENFLIKEGLTDFEGVSIPNHLRFGAQEVYRREFLHHIEKIYKNIVYIDKLPLNLLETALIHQLYPEAKFILALRHPMDTILSCWMQNFQINPAMANMVDLNRIVEFYCVAMEIFKLCRDKYNLNVHEVRYENLIDNFQNEATAILEFLNLQWEPEMKNYQHTALKSTRRINTPSYSQVVEPIYKDSKYRWVNYQRFLEQYLSQLDPWLSEFGYN